MLVQFLCVPEVCYAKGVVAGEDCGWCDETVRKYNQEMRWSSVHLRVDSWVSIALIKSIRFRVEIMREALMTTHMEQSHIRLSIHHK